MALMLSAMRPALSAPTARLAGVEAFSSGQSVHATLEVRKLGPRRIRIALREYGGSPRRLIRFYDRDMTKYLHLIAVDGDLRSFQHVHPILNAGVFGLAMAFPHGGPWHLYADAIPHNFGREVFRFDLSLPPGGAAAPPIGPGSVRRVPPYTVRLDRTAVPAGRLTMLAVRISQAGRLARGLRPYLGARAHAVLVGARDLSYLHVHAMSAGMRMNPASMPSSASMPMSMPMPMSDTSPAAAPTDDPCNADAAVGMSLVELPADAHVAPAMSIMLQPAKAGPYVLWIQFRDRAKVVTAAFLIHAR